MTDETPLSPEAARALKGLREPESPPDALYRSVLSGMRERTAARRPAPWVRIASIAAALVVAFAGGRWSAPGADAPPATEPAFAFLMLRTPATSYPSGLSELDVVGLYRDWAGGLAQRGRFMLGEELSPTRLLVDSASARETPAAEGVDGMFVVRAPGLDSAVALARTLPHVRYGGVVAVQPLMVR